MTLVPQTTQILVIGGGPGGSTAATLLARQGYDVTLLELQRGVAVREWRDTSGALRYAVASPGDGYEDRGVAFYGSDRAIDGLVPIYERRDGDAYTYVPTPADASAQPAFYAPCTRALSENSDCAR